MFATRTSRVNQHDLNLSQRLAETLIMHAEHRPSNLSDIPQQKNALFFCMYSIKIAIQAECFITYRFDPTAEFKPACVSFRIIDGAARSRLLRAFDA